MGEWESWLLDRVRQTHPAVQGLLLITAALVAAIAIIGFAVLLGKAA